MHSNSKYIVITECDIVLHEYYITRRHKSKMIRYEKLGYAHELQ